MNHGAVHKKHLGAQLFPSLLQYPLSAVQSRDHCRHCVCGIVSLGITISESKLAWSSTSTASAPANQHYRPPCSTCLPRVESGSTYSTAQTGSTTSWAVVSTIKLHLQATINCPLPHSLRVMAQEAFPIRCGCAAVGHLTCRFFY